MKECNSLQGKGNKSYIQDVRIDDYIFQEVDKKVIV